MKIGAAGILGVNPAACALASGLAAEGVQVRLLDEFKDNLRLALARAAWTLEKAGKRSSISNIEPVQEAKKMSGADIVLETGTLADEGRLSLLSAVSEAAGENCVIGLSARSRVEPTANSLSSPERCVGVNFHACPAGGWLSEIIRPALASAEAVELCSDSLKRAGLSVIFASDCEGAVVQRLRLAYIFSAVQLLESGKGFPRELDEAVRTLCGSAVGPLELADSLGLDNLSPASAPPSIAKLSKYGQLGKKTGLGFYIYDDGSAAGENPALSDMVRCLGISAASRETVFLSVMRAVVAQAQALVNGAAASEYDVETAAKLALGWKKGPFGWKRELGEKLSVSAPSPDAWGDAL